MIIGNVCTGIIWQSSATLIETYPLLSRTICSPSFLRETIVKIVGDIGALKREFSLKRSISTVLGQFTWLPPWFFFQRFKFNFMCWGAVNFAYSIKVFDVEFSLLLAQKIPRWLSCPLETRSLGICNLALVDSDLKRTK